MGRGGGDEKYDGVVVRGHGKGGRRRRREEEEENLRASAKYTAWGLFVGGGGKGIFDGWCGKRFSWGAVRAEVVFLRAGDVSWLDSMWRDGPPATVEVRGTGICWTTKHNVVGQVFCWSGGRKRLSVGGKNMGGKICATVHSLRQQLLATESRSVGLYMRTTALLALEVKARRAVVLRSWHSREPSFSGYAVYGSLFLEVDRERAVLRRRQSIFGRCFIQRRFIRSKGRLGLGWRVVLPGRAEGWGFVAKFVCLPGRAEGRILFQGQSSCSNSRVEGKVWTNPQSSR